jgi:hypothetical protein
MRPARPRSAWRRAAEELGEGELPAQQHRHDDAQLDDQVGGGELERHRRGEVGALAEDRPGQRHRRIRTRRGGRTESGRDGQRLGESSGSSRLISRFDTTACTAPDRAKPRMSAHRISQNIANARLRACPSPPSKVLMSSLPS